MRPEDVRSQDDLQAFLDGFESQLEALSSDISKRVFLRYTQGVKDDALPQLEKKRADMLLDPALSQLVTAWADRVVEPTLARRVENWQSQLQLAQVSALPEIRELARELNDQLVGHRYPLAGEGVDITTIRQTLRSHPDREMRKQAWHSPGQLSEKMAPRLIELIKRRNKAAQDLGYETYADMMLEHSELSLDEAESTLEHLASATDERYKGLLEEGAKRLGLSSIEPWDVQYILESRPGVSDQLFPKDGISPALGTWANSMGLDLDKLGIEMVNADIPYNGLCMSIGRREIKILGNPSHGYGYYKTAFHELGHSLHSALCSQDYISLRREASVFSEAMAEVFGYVPLNPAWFAARGLGETEAKAALEASIGPWFHYLRQRSAYALFEYNLYRDPQLNPDEELAKVEARILGCQENGASRWAANAWFVNYPVYWQNYVLADVIASQVHQYLNTHMGPLHHSREALDYVVDKLIAPGGIRPWKVKLQEATGKGLDADALVKDLKSSR